MSYAERQTLAVTTAADGSYTGSFARVITGKIKQIIYTKPGSGGMDNGSTITFTNKETGETIWSESGVNASAVRAPRLPTHSTAGVASLYAAAGQAVNDTIAIAGDHVQVAITSGGNAKNATFDIVYE